MRAGRAKRFFDCLGTCQALFDAQCFREIQGRLDQPRARFFRETAFGEEPGDFHMVARFGSMRGRFGLLLF